MRALIIDDEVKARENLEQLLKMFCPQLQILAVADNISDGEALLRQHEIDILFLDIEMPNGNGFELLKRFGPYTFKVVLITAYDQYAIQAIRAQAMDYLLKPIDIDELIEAVKKVETGMLAKEENDMPLFKSGSAREKLALPMKDGYVFLSFSDIVRIESDGSYTTFFTNSTEKHVVSRHMKEFERLLPDKQFFRCHKSHIINLDCVKRFVRNDGFLVELSDGTTVEISRRKKDEFLNCMQQ